MNEILRVLLAGGEVKIGIRARIYAYQPPTEITIRLANSLMGPSVKPTVRGLRELLRWLDEQPPQVI